MDSKSNLHLHAVDGAGQADLWHVAAVGGLADGAPQLEVGARGPVQLVLVVQVEGSTAGVNVESPDSP